MASDPGSQRYQLAGEGEDRAIEIEVDNELLEGTDRDRFLCRWLSKSRIPDPKPESDARTPAPGPVRMRTYVVRCSSAGGSVRLDSLREKIRGRERNWSAVIVATTEALCASQAASVMALGGGGWPLP